MNAEHDNRTLFVTRTVQSYVSGLNLTTPQDVTQAVDAALLALHSGQSGASAFATGVRTAMQLIDARRAKAKIIYLTDRIKMLTPMLQAG